MRRTALNRLCVTLVAGALLSGCWLQVGYGPENQRFNTSESGLTRANVTQLRQAWSVALPGADVSEPIVDANLAYVSSSQGPPTYAARVHAVNIQNGATAWQRQLFASGPGTGSSASATPVAMSGDELWADHWGIVPHVGSPSSCHAAQVQLDPASGAILESEPNVFALRPVTGGGIVAQTEVRVTSPCERSPVTLRVREAETLDELWTFALPGEPDTGPLFAPAMGGGRIFVAKDSTLYAFPASGCGASTCSPTWSVNFEIPTHEGTRIVGSPIAGPGGRVFVATSPGRLGGGGMRALDAATGAALWQAPLNPSGSAGALAVANGVVYVSITGSGTSGSLRAFDAAGCGAATCSTPLWTGRLSGSGSATAPVVAGGVVYVGDGGNIEAFDARGCGSATCPRIWLGAVASTSEVSHLSVAQGRLFVSSTGRLTTFAPA